MVIDVVGLTKRFGAFTAVEDVSFSIPKGEVAGFVGLNGAGKSTTINLLLGFLRPTDGEVRLFGEPVSPKNAQGSHRRIGFASGDMNLFTNMTGKQYFAFIRRVYGRRDTARLGELCQLFEPQLDKRIGELSRGNRQKVALIGAFMASPELVILDEPSSGLDPLMQQTFLRLVREESERGTTVFMSSHYLGEVVDVCSRILFMRQGKLVRDVTAAEIALLGGKLVRVVTERSVPVPSFAHDPQYHKAEASHQLSFVYHGPTQKLQQWLAGIPHMIDFSVVEHDPEMVFSELYTGKKREGRHV